MSTCRFCKENLSISFADLGLSPVSNAFIERNESNQPEVFFPLQAWVCGNCFLVQALEIAGAEKHFHDNYIYFSSFSKGWVEHARKFVEVIRLERQLSDKSQVIELASNDGYLLQHFLPFRIPVLGIEPSGNVAAEARKKGVPTIVKFFGSSLATELRNEGKAADLLVANNVLAHVPDIIDFVKGIKIILKHDGVASLEFPWLLNLIKERQFDTIYHEHYSYLSLVFLTRLFRSVELVIYKVEKLATHGGSLRVYVKHLNNKKDAIEPSVEQIYLEEIEAGLTRTETYVRFQEEMVNVKLDLLAFLIDKKRKGEKVVGYGAPAKGNTLLNFCGIGPELIPFTVDLSPHKQGKLMPGSRIPVRLIDDLLEAKPKYVLILPWNIKDEIIAQLKELKEQNCTFITAIPNLEIF